MYTLYIGNKNYSTWSLRGWLATKLSGAPFREVMVHAVGRRTIRRIAAFSPTARVPCAARRRRRRLGLARHRRVSRRAARRHVARRRRSARAYARSIACEMHSGFAHLRNDMTMCIRERVDVRPWSPELAADIARVVEIWTEARGRFGKGGPYLMGAFTLADVFYAPVSFRFRTYGVDARRRGGARISTRSPRIRSLREWEAAARAETDDRRGRRAARHLSRQDRALAAGGPPRP